MKRRVRLIVRLVGWLTSWGLAYAVMFNDIDFFTFQDLFDTTQLHHEHIVAGLVILGLLFLIVPAYPHGSAAATPLRAASRADPTMPREFCPYCGYEVPASSPFCGLCGNRLHESRTW